MPVPLKQYGKSDGKKTKLLRYDVYLHERRDETLIDYLKQFENEDRGRNAEMKRLMYAGLDCEQQAPPAPQMRPKQATLPEAPPTMFDSAAQFDSEPTTVRSKLKRAFG